MVNKQDVSLSRWQQGKQAVRARLGFYYRLWRQYFKNKAVYRQMANLSGQPLRYYSVLQKREVAESEVIDLVNDGDIIRLTDMIGQLKLNDAMNQLIHDAFDVNLDQLAQIHQQKSLEFVVENAFEAKDSIAVLAMQGAIMQRLLKPHGEQCYLELQPLLRLHLPYSCIKGKEDYIESVIGRGKINPHGQHKDSWRFHPKNTFNVWVALTQANDKNGMAILPQSVDYYPQYDGQEKEMVPGMKTYPSLQWVTDLQPGDALIFRAELLHGSIINMTRQTRVAFSMRCSLTEPEFHHITQPNYIKVSERGFDNLTWLKIKRQGNYNPPSRDEVFAPLEALNSTITPVSYDDKEIILTIDGQPRSFPRFCPHAGADLLKGELNAQGQLLCPSHRMCLAGKKVVETTSVD